MSLLGLPPLAGFVDSLEIFKAPIDADQAWLAVVAIANIVVSIPVGGEGPHCDGDF